MQSNKSDAFKQKLIDLDNKFNDRLEAMEKTCRTIAETITENSIAYRLRTLESERLFQEKWDAIELEAEK